MTGPGDTRETVDRSGDLETTFRAGHSSDQDVDTQDFVIIDHSSSEGSHGHIVFDDEGNEIYSSGIE